MRKIITVLLSVMLFVSCKTPLGIFNNQTPHEDYQRKLNNANLNATALGRCWIESAESALTNTVVIKLPYKEIGYFDAARPAAVSFKFNASKGQLINIIVAGKKQPQAKLFVDLFQNDKHVKSMDTSLSPIQYKVNNEDSFTLRIQPELLVSCNYELTINVSASLAYPVSNPTSKNGVISFWGAGRDAGARKHEGVDIAGSFRTPVVAVGEGIVTSVSENRLGGKVVFVRSIDDGESWYYAHLDSQIARVGQQVSTGEVVGLMGNTGNAKHTVTHLHFGIYTGRGAVDPFPFINPAIKKPVEISAAENNIGTYKKVIGKPYKIYFTPEMQESIVLQDAPLFVTGATKNLYKVLLPDDSNGFIPIDDVKNIDIKSRPLKLTSSTELLNKPMEESAIISTIPQGSNLSVLGTFKNYQFVRINEMEGWIQK